MWNPNFCYEVNNKRREEYLDKRLNRECTKGIHFFLNKTEAVNSSAVFPPIGDPGVIINHKNKLKIIN